MICANFIIEETEHIKYSDAADLFGDNQPEGIASV